MMVTCPQNPKRSSPTLKGSNCFWLSHLQEALGFRYIAVLINTWYAVLGRPQIEDPPFKHVQIWETVKHLRFDPYLDNLKHLSTTQVCTNGLKPLGEAPRETLSHEILSISKPGLARN